MSIKSILVPFSGTKEEVSAMNTAYSIGKTDGAHIRVIYILPNVDNILYSEGEKSWMETEHTEQSNIALERFKTFSSLNQIPVVSFDDIPENGISASFTVIRGSFRDVVSYCGKVSDMIVIDRAIQEFGDTVESPVISAVMDTGKGTLLLPPDKGFAVGDAVMIAWNGSLQAARAVNNALPILRHASKVFIVTDGTLKKNMPDQEALASYLKLHDITAQTVHIGRAVYNDDDTATVLFTDEAIKLHCKLIVMGAFTHHPLKQMVLGGMTRGMLKSNRIPVFMTS